MALTRISFAAAAAADDKDKDTEEVIVGDGGIREKGRDRSRNEDKNNAAVIRDKGRGSSGLQSVCADCFYLLVRSFLLRVGCQRQM